MTDMYLVTRYCKVVPTLIAKIQDDEDKLEGVSFHAILPVDGTRVFKNRDEAVKYARQCNYELNYEGKYVVPIFSFYTDFGITPIKIDDNGVISKGDGQSWIETAINSREAGE